MELIPYIKVLLLQKTLYFQRYICGTDFANSIYIMIPRAIEKAHYLNQMINVAITTRLKEISIDPPDGASCKQGAVKKVSTARHAQQKGTDTPPIVYPFFPAREASSSPHIKSMNQGLTRILQ